MSLQGELKLSVTYVDKISSPNLLPLAKNVTTVSVQ